METIYYDKIYNNKSENWIVFVHGFVQNHKLFKHQIEYFKKDFNLLLLDLRGHGLSCHIGDPYGLEEYADDIEKIIVENNINNIHYWGTHTGTGIGYILYFRQAERFTKLIMEGSILPGYQMKRVNELIERTKSIAALEGIEKAKTDWFYYADWYDYIRNNTEQCRAEEHLKIVEEFHGKPWLSKTKAKDITNIDDKLSKIKIPLLLYNGEKDMDEFFVVSDRILNKCFDATRKTIAKAGAFPCWENYEEVNKTVETFINK